MKKLKKFLKSLNFIEWCQLLLILLVFLVGIITIFTFCFKLLFVGEPITKTTPAGTYTCTGGLIKVCTGSKEVADYLGV